MDQAGSVYDNPDLRSARSNYESASSAATNAEASGYTLPDQLKSALTAKFSQDNPLVQNRESALKNYLNATTQAPLNVTAQSAGGNAPVVLNPLQQADLIQRQKSSALAPLASANTLLDLSTGGMGNIIDSASRAYQGETARKQGAAKIAGERYQSVLNELSQRAQERQQLRDEQFREKQYQEDVRRYEAGKARANVPQIDWADEYKKYLESQQTQVQGLAPGEQGSVLPEGTSILDYNNLLNQMGGY